MENDYIYCFKRTDGIVEVNADCSMDFVMNALVIIFRRLDKKGLIKLYHFLATRIKILGGFEND